MQILKGHISPETAYLVDDYPYGFKLRCKIRYWLEHHPRKGTRFVSQTTNPRKGGFWNKPKASTYAYIAGCMFLNEDDHVTWDALSEYESVEQCETWLATYREGLPVEVVQRIEDWISSKELYQYNKVKAQERIL